VILVVQNVMDDVLVRVSVFPADGVTSAFC
jgi:hypothetical protein